MCSIRTADFAHETQPVPEPENIPRKQESVQGTLYLRLPTRDDRLFPKIRAILNMFPGESQAVVFFADTRQRLGARCALDKRMLQELENVLGEANVVVK